MNAERVFGLFLAKCLILVSACGDSVPEFCPNDGPTGCPTFCYSGEELGPSDSQRTCAPPCGEDADCAGSYRCALLEGGTMGCLPSCEGERGIPGFACLSDGRFEHCSEVEPGEVPCGECCLRGETCSLCADGEICGGGSGGGACLTPAPPGGECWADHDCAKQNCSTGERFGHLVDEPGFCFVGHGEVCTGDNCSRCIATGGTTFCHRRAHDCAGCDHCFGSRELDAFWCHEDAMGPRIDELTCPDGYYLHRYDGTNATCLPNEDAFVCGTASIGPPCDP